MGDFLTTPNKTKDSFDGENNYVRFGASAMQGWRYRMEDAHLHSLNNSNLDIFGVFDGHGGKEVSQFVKNHFIEEFMNNQNTKYDNIPNSLIETFLKMDELLRSPKGKEELSQLNKLSKLEDDEQDKKDKKGDKNLYKCLDPKNAEDCDIANITGCTACVSVINEKNKKIYFANAGDSRVVYCKNGKAEEGSTDHKPELESEKNRIYKADGWISDGRVKGNLNLTRGFGDLEYKQNKSLKPEEQIITANPDIKIIDFTEDIDFIIIGCDGIWDCLTNQEACDFVSKRLKDTPDIKISKIVEEMLDSIVAKDLYNETGVGCDNMTCIVIVFKKEKSA